MAEPTLIRQETCAFVKILSESAIAAGVRRIELVCGQYAFNHLNNYATELEKISKIFKVPPHESLVRVEKLIEESKQYQKK